MTVVRRQLLALAQSIPVPASGDVSDGEAFTTAPMPGSACHMLGRDSAGFVAVLISIDSRFPLGPLPPVRLDNLAVVHAARCVVSKTGEPSVPGVFSVVRCLSEDPELVELFIGVMASVSQQFPGPSSTQEVAQVIDRVIRLFRDLGKPSERAVQGLWAELFVIARSADPATVVSAWRSSLFDRSDFATDQQRLEIKSTAGHVRSHVFSAEQLRTPTGTMGVVASLFCQRSAGGISVGELWSMVRRQLVAEPSLLLRVDSIVAETLGEAWKQSLQLRYDWQTARDSIRFFLADAIPSVGSNIPPQISEIRFRVDLSSMDSLTAVAMSQMGGLLAAASAPLRGSESQPE